MATGQDVANFAMKYRGTPIFDWRTGEKKFDSVSFVLFCYKHAAQMELPYGTKYLINMGKKVNRKDLKPGDLVFPHSGHVGISIGGERYIHAPATLQVRDAIKEASIRKFYTARRIL